jgi:hypothetical protein
MDIESKAINKVMKFLNGKSKAEQLFLLGSVALRLGAPQAAGFFASLAEELAKPQGETGEQR